jgi:hypothetical protein
MDFLEWLQFMIYNTRHEIMEQGTTTIDGIWYARNMNFFSKERH